MSGERNEFPDDLKGTGLSVCTHLDCDGDLWIAVVNARCIDFESVLISKDEASRLAEVLQRYIEG